MIKIIIENIDKFDIKTYDDVKLTCDKLSDNKINKDNSHKFKFNFKTSNVNIFKVFKNMFISEFMKVYPLPIAKLKNSKSNSITNINPIESFIEGIGLIKIQYDGN